MNRSPKLRLLATIALCVTLACVIAMFLTDRYGTWIDIYFYAACAKLSAAIAAVLLFASWLTRKET